MDKDMLEYKERKNSYNFVVPTFRIGTCSLCSTVQLFLYVCYRGFIQLQQTYKATVKIFQGNFVNSNHAFVRMREVMGFYFEFQNQNQK